jgi:hypothetical protein
MHFLVGNKMTGLLREDLTKSSRSISARRRNGGISNQLRLHRPEK